MSTSISVDARRCRFSTWPSSVGTGDVFRFVLYTVFSAAEGASDCFCRCRTCSRTGRSDGAAGPFLIEILLSTPFFACCDVVGWVEGVGSLTELGITLVLLTSITATDFIDFVCGSSREHVCGSRREKPVLQLVASSSPRQWLSTSI